MISKLRDRLFELKLWFKSSPSEGGASSGQVLVMFAFFLTAMIGMLGLAVDVGFAYSERRTIQNSADLAAVAGARAVARYTSGSSLDALTDVGPIVTDNHMAETSTLLEECVYLDQFGQEVGSCGLTVPANATGVHVQVSETHSTYFIKVVPGAPVSVTTRASASAQIERYDLAGMDTPFILCGYDTVLSGGGTRSVLLSDYVTNPDAVGETFRLSGPNKTDIARCGASGSYADKWRGLADKSANLGHRIIISGSTTDDWWNPKIGSPSTSATSLDFEVPGIDGCEKNTAAPYNCIMLMPIATSYDTSTRRFKVTKVVGMRVWRDSSNSSTYYGTLVDDYLVYGGSVPLSVDQAPWCRDCGSVVVVRLVE